MLPWILAAVVILPVAEIAVFVEIGSQWGLWPTIGTVFATAVARCAERVVAAQTHAPQLLFEPLHDGQVALDVDGRARVVLGRRPHCDGWNEGHVHPRDLETVARKASASVRALASVMPTP